MKLEVGMYVRTKDGHIDKIIKINNKSLNGRTIQVEKGKIDCCMGYEDFTDLFNLSHYEKASYSIIDLIEVGDYVNGEKVLHTNCKLEYLDDDSETGVNEVYNGLELTNHWIYFEHEIKSIVTKEQFEQMSYKIGDDEK